MRYLLFMLVLSSGLSWAESRRIEVYPLSQNYWDVKTGDTLGEIIEAVMPRNPYLQAKLMRDILALNPDVFPDGNPHRMLADKRLWLPNAARPQRAAVGSSDHAIETYQWGNVKRRNKGRGTRGEN